MKWFKRTPLIVEVEKPRALQPLDPETAKSVAILAEFPGFQYLLAKCRFQGAILKSTLDKQRQRSLDDVAFLQAGIAWCGWLESELATATNMVNRPAPTPATPSELEAFEELRKQLTLVGQKPL